MVSGFSNVVAVMTAVLPFYIRRKYVSRYDAVVGSNDVSGKTSCGGGSSAWRRKHYGVWRGGVTARRLAAAAVCLAAANGWRRRGDQWQAA